MERSMTTPTAFTIEHLQTHAGNRDGQGRATLADAYVRIGPFRFTANVMPTGEVLLPHSLTDQDLAQQIRDELRSRTVELLHETWGKLSAGEARNAAARRAARETG